MNFHQKQHFRHEKKFELLILLAINTTSFKSLFQITAGEAIEWLTTGDDGYSMLDGRPCKPYDEVCSTQFQFCSQAAFGKWVVTITVGRNLMKRFPFELSADDPVVNIVCNVSTGGDAIVWQQTYSDGCRKNGDFLKHSEKCSAKLGRVNPAAFFDSQSKLANDAKFPSEFSGTIPFSDQEKIDCKVDKQFESTLLRLMKRMQYDEHECDRIGKYFFPIQLLEMAEIADMGMDVLEVMNHPTSP